MKSGFITMLFAACVIFTASGLSAQDDSDKKDKTIGDSSSEQSGFPVTLEFSSSGYHFNNPDFTNYSHNKFVANQSVDYLNSDDRVSFVYSSLVLSFQKKHKKTEFFLKMYRSGFWGSDNMEGRDDGGNPILYNQLYFNFYFNPDTMLSFGRHRFSIGDSENDFFFKVESGHRDYFFSDTIDGITFKQNYKIDGRPATMTLMGDILGMGARPDDSRIWFGVSKDPEEMDNFNGDVISARAGAMFDYWFAKVFAFYLRYGATSEGGADISENGKNQINQADNDFLLMGGTRLSHDFNELGKIDFTFAWSVGRDYQFDATHKYNGFGTSLNYSYPLKTVLDKVSLSLGYFDPDFCSMKADSPAGLTMWAYKGYFASPYAYFYHFKDYQKRDYEVSYVDKTISKSFGKIMFDFLFFSKLKVYTGFLALFANDYSGSVAYMGTEAELNIGYQYENLRFELRSGLYLPSGYYKERSVSNTYMPAGDDPFYGGGLICTYILDFGK